jgi:hypothetical protein
VLLGISTFLFIDAVQWCAKPTIMKSHFKAYSIAQKACQQRIEPQITKFGTISELSLSMRCANFSKTLSTTCQTQNFEPRWKRNKRKKELVYPFPAYFLTLRMSGKLRQKGRPLQSAVCAPTCERLTV